MSINKFWESYIQLKRGCLYQTAPFFLTTRVFNKSGEELCSFDKTVDFLSFVYCVYSCSVVLAHQKRREPIYIVGYIVVKLGVGGGNKWIWCGQKVLEHLVYCLGQSLIGIAYDVGYRGGFVLSGKNADLYIFYPRLF